MPFQPPFKSVTIQGTRAGPRLIVLGAVHGNETCGTVAQQRVLADIDAGALTIAAGRVTFVPVANALAYARGQRTGDRNLNRALGPIASPVAFEDHVANWLCPLLAAHDVLLDLHSFQAQGEPFVMVGPLDNDGAVEPFALADREHALARHLGVRRAVDGWLGTYAAGARRRAARAVTGDGSHDIDWHCGVGTTEYMRSTGGCALTLECGQHADPAAPDVAERAIRNTLAWLRLVDRDAPPDEQAMESLHLDRVVDKLHPGDTLARAWRSFDPVDSGTLIATRADGEELRATWRGRVVFPNVAAQPGEEWFYMARESTRFSDAA